MPSVGRANGGRCPQACHRQNSDNAKQRIAHIYQTPVVGHVGSRFPSSVEHPSPPHYVDERSETYSSVTHSKTHSKRGWCRTPSPPGQDKREIDEMVYAGTCAHVLILIIGREKS